jgi:hypothetical protein
MQSLPVKTFQDLMHGHNYAEITNIIHGNIVRKLTITEKNQVQIDALEPPILTIHLNTPIHYQPWFMDRGSLTFTHPDLPNAKICTEYDIITYPDGTQYEITPTQP